MWQGWWTWRRLLLVVLAGLLVGGGLHVRQLDQTVRERFEGPRWQVPARVYARPQEVFAGQELSRAELVAELEALGYARVASAVRPGTYALDGPGLELHSRGFRFWDGRESPQRLRLAFEGGRISALTDAAGSAPGLLRLEPREIGAIYPGHREDRVLIRLPAVPEHLVAALVAVEDRDFYRHLGVSPKAIARAALANLRAGRTVQGGSTLTQQLVKNFYLSSERTLWRKANEAVMALILDARYDKDAILEAYLNEVYLGQDGRRAIHGVGLASRFFFGQPVSELQPAQSALLVAMVKGPSYYDPRRHPERARGRRDLVLALMRDQGFITPAEAERAMARPLGVVDRPPSADPHPAFLDLVRRQLSRDYRDEDLQSDGLRIFTTLDPRVQAATEAAVSRRLERLERSRGLPGGSLQASVVVTEPASGEVLGLVGGRDPRFAGFNRALDARRPVGSLIKPAVYLTALSDGDYNLATLLRDEPITVERRHGEDWAPRNYSRESHGEVALWQALAHSYNLASVRLGLDVGLERVRETLRRLGIERELNPYPSLLLGAVDFSPVEVARVYQTLAAGGFRTPLRAIRAVLDAHGEPLQRYPLAVEQVADPGPVYLVTHAMQRAVAEGTGRAIHEVLPMELGIAGKTGTTDDLRDSWFAGFTGGRLAVAWVGRDDNGPMGLTGSAGALRVWRDLMAELGPRPLRQPVPADVETVWIEPATGLRSGPDCPGAIELPFMKGTAPTTYGECGASVGERLKRGWRWLKGQFE